MVIFYPSDWEEDASSLLLGFSSLHSEFESSNCRVYGCSTDSVASHLAWLGAEFSAGLPFPLLSDPAGHLASRFSVFLPEERLSIRAVVITDTRGSELEVITSSLGSKELATYCLNTVRQVDNPRRAKRTPRRDPSGSRFLPKLDTTKRVSRHGLCLVYVAH